MPLHQEILDKARKDVFLKLVNFKKDGYLAGGTSLALQIGHRVSYDFDIFCPKEILNSLILKVRKIFSVKNVLVNSRDEFSFIDKDGIKVSFIFYPFDLKKFIIKNTGLIDFLSPDGIAMAKAYALGRRASWRDYVDLFFVLKTKKKNLEKIVLESKKIYQEFFSEKLFLAQLVYTKDIDKKEVKETMFIGKKVTLEEVKQFFKQEIKNYLK